jgi:predicted dinucleotide-binding enzyme
MKLAIIGAGSVGGTLGTVFAQKAGHEIFFGVRDPKSDKVRTARSPARRRPARQRKQLLSPITSSWRRRERPKRNPLHG